MAQQTDTMVHHTFEHNGFKSVVWSVLQDGTARFTHSVRMNGTDVVRDQDHGDDAAQARRDHLASVDMYLDTLAAGA